MFPAIFFNVSKRTKSTKRPSLESGTAIDIELKEKTDILNPQLVLRQDPTDYNYCYIDKFNRYYYITSVAYDRGLWVITLTVDYLASWKNAIRTRSCFVQYSSSDYDINLTDNRLIATNEKRYHKKTIPLANGESTAFFSRKGTYIINAVSVYGSGGPVATYALNLVNMNAFNDYVFSNDFLQNVWNSLRDLFQNPMDCIVSCKWIPVDYSSISATEVDLYLSYINTHVTAKYIAPSPLSDDATAAYTINATYTTPIERIDDDNPSFLDVSPFSTGILYLPFIGYVPFDIDTYYKKTQFSFTIHLDISTGDIVYDIGAMLALNTSSYTGNCAVNIPLSRNFMDVVGTAGSTVTTIGGSQAAIAAITEGINPGLGAIASMAVGSLGVVKSAETHTQINGGVSGRAQMRMPLDVIYYIIRNEVTEQFDDPERIADIGLPCMKVVNLGTLSGYVKCSNFEITGAGMLYPEMEYINAVMNGSGVYLE